MINKMRNYIAAKSANVRSRIARNKRIRVLKTQSAAIVLHLIIYIKKLIDTDWLRAVEFKCTLVQKV